MAETQNATDSSPVTGYGIRSCRGHWHLTHGDEDIGPAYPSRDEALRVADQNNAGDHSEPKGFTNEDALNLARGMMGLRYTKGIPINKVSTVNLITSPAEDVLFDKVNEIIDRINKMNEAQNG